MSFFSYSIEAEPVGYDFINHPLCDAGNDFLFAQAQGFLFVPFPFPFPFGARQAFGPGGAGTVGTACDEVLVP